MLQNKFEMPLDLRINDSKILQFYCNLIFFLSFISIFISSLNFSVQLLLCLALLSFAFFTFKKQNSNKITSLYLSPDNEWQVEVNKQNIDVELYGECIVTYFLIWLNFTTCNKCGKIKKHHVLLLPDSSDKDLLRRLRVRLRFLKKDKDIFTTEDTEVHRGKI